MSHTITNDCIGCDRCLPVCPTNAITKDDWGYAIDPQVCNDCVGFYGVPQCAAICPTNYGCIPGTSMAFRQPLLRQSQDYWEQWFATYNSLISKLHESKRTAYWQRWFDTYAQELSKVLSKHHSSLAEV